MQEEQASRYKIGAVAKLTGLPTETIRTWERRHALVVPERTESGLRLYSADDVAVLRSVRTLCEQGESVSRLAGLSLDDLRARLGRHAGWAMAARKRLTSDKVEPRLGIVGAGLSRQAQHLEADLGSDWTVTWRFGSVPSSAGLGQVDVLLCDLRALGDHPLERLKELAEETAARVSIVVYDYLSVAEIQTFSLVGVKLLRGPVRAPLLLRAIQDYFELATLREGAFAEQSAPKREAGGNTSPIFSREQLAQLQDIKTSITCECPSQLSGIVSALVAFEDYSRNCENKNEADALLHARLADRTREVRAAMEQLLVEVCKHEQIAL